MGVGAGLRRALRGEAGRPRAHQPGGAEPGRRRARGEDGPQARDARAGGARRCGGPAGARPGGASSTNAVTWDRAREAPPMLHVAFEYEREVTYPILGRTGTKLFTSWTSRATSRAELGTAALIGEDGMNAQEMQRAVRRVGRGDRGAREGGGRRARPRHRGDPARRGVPRPAAPGGARRGARRRAALRDARHRALPRRPRGEGRGAGDRPDRHPVPGARARRSCSSTTCSTPGAPCAPRSTSSSTSGGRGASGSRCSWTAAGASCRSPADFVGVRIEVADRDGRAGAAH